MKIILVYPGITSLGFNSLGIGAEGSWINHGLCSISACAKLKGYEVKLVDLRKISGWKEFKKIIRKENPHVVGVTMVSVDYDPAIKSLSCVKEVSKNIITVVGGPHPSIMPEECAKNDNIDYVVKGEGEISFLELLDSIENNVFPKEKIILGKPAELDNLPFSDRDLFEVEEQPWWLTDKKPFVTIIAGRGCIYNCSFCQPAERMIFGRRVRRRSVKNVIEELKLLRDKYKFKSFMFHDDCLIENPTWVEEFLIKYKEEGFNQEFICQGRADIICKRPDLISKMKQAGLVGIIIGFESGNQRVLDFLHKRTTVEQNLMAAEICHNLGIKIQGNYMLGIPTETKEEMMDTINMMKKIKPEVQGCSFYTPSPGSELFNYCIEKNLLDIKSHNDYRRDPYRRNKIKGIDYNFLLKISDEINNQGLSRTKILLNKIIYYVVRKNKFTLWIIKKFFKIKLIRELGHLIVRKSSS